MSGVVHSTVRVQKVNKKQCMCAFGSKIPDRLTLVLGQLTIDVYSRSSCWHISQACAVYVVEQFFRGKNNIGARQIRWPQSRLETVEQLVSLQTFAWIQARNCFHLSNFYILYILTFLQY